MSFVRWKPLMALLAAASLFVPTADAMSSQPGEDRPACGRYPRVAARRDCWVVENRDVARRWRVKPVAKCIRHWESGHDYRAVSPRGSFRGAYQFKQSTFDSLGPDRLDGIPAHRAPRFLQDLKARRLVRRQGLRPWPTPNERC